MSHEFSALLKNKTWELVPGTPDMNIIRSLWLFKHNFRSNGTLERYKARLVCDGRKQQLGVDCGDTFTPVAKPSTIRLVLSLALSKSWQIHQLDVTNAFLHGNLEETVYMHQPMGFRHRDFPDHACLLRKSLYGLKQAPRAWYQRFTDFVTLQGFRQSKSDNSLFLYHHGHEIADLLIYVDDIILTTSSEDLRKRLLHKLSGEFAMKDLGPLSYFLGIQVTREGDTMFLSQQAYVRDILHRASMDSYKPVATTVDTQSKLSAHQGPLHDDPSTFRSLAGALQYLTITRPDISYVVQQICMHMHVPRIDHWNALKHILRYLQGTAHFGLHPGPVSSIRLIAYTDWAGCPDTRRSTSGYCVYFGDNHISWSSKRQSTISRSSAEAEYQVLLMWLRIFVGCVIFFSSSIILFHALRWFIVIMSVPSTSLVIMCNISTLSTLSSTFTSFMNWCNAVTFVCYMFLLAIRLPIYSPRVSRVFYLTIFVPVSTSVLPMLQLRGYRGVLSEEDRKGLDVPFFEFKRILSATENFSLANKLGQGGFGPVYKGTFPEGAEMAVKRLSSQSKQGLKEFKNEVLLIAKLQHRNLIRLLGYSMKNHEMILLYEYMPNKSLDHFIFDKPLNL
ncbi:putative RNA-directed DNA polymerase, protein kinase RLK-Pelle-DLSV family [Helianthus annuus]|uniref:RNA-directed DNA polymerase, protein kinase RLK-Pelle-DLSV family n=1 Tax=Helianthus annuus TaxID=4232 RepID=A0A9K3H4I4_HELAN|nr:putative RNA-directed DNA polymerase, protein kinase RLK-Pelle-DLSV family [Helianthus annuus]KAJ0831261.1 putative RNA-directed DNA polymerase, protein kinase RLK-Pelle-DLSV family [Helianthus annuus]